MKKDQKKKLIHPNSWNSATHYGMCGQSCPCCRNQNPEDTGACLVCPIMVN